MAQTQPNMPSKKVHLEQFKNDLLESISHGGDYVLPVLLVKMCDAILKSIE